MVIVSAKVSKRKVLLGLLAALCVAGLLAVLLHHASDSDSAAPALSVAAGTNEERVSFLAQYGWAVRPEPVETQEVRIPEEFNDVFTRYNQLQQDQGFDLADYAGKPVKRYVYAITNHPDGTVYFATLLVYHGTVIGGDVTPAADGGTMTGFALPQQPRATGQ